MNSEREDRLVEGAEDSLIQHLKPDIPEVMKIKNLRGKELEYAEYPGTIEYSIAKYFYENDRKLKDRDAVSALKNIRENYDKNVSFFKIDLEKEIISNLIELLKEKPITHHEFQIIIDYVLEVIDNRAWMDDEQAYLKWVAYIMGLFTEKESNEYERSVEELAAKLGLSSKHVDYLLLRGKEDGNFDFLETYGTDEEATEEELIAEMEEKFLSMTDSEKFDFLMENGPDFYELVGLYISVLSEGDEFEKLNGFYSKFVEKYNDFIYLDVYMGEAYIEKDPALAKTYFEKALKKLDRLDEVSESTKEILRFNLLDLIERIK